MTVRDVSKISKMTGMTVGVHIKHIKKRENMIFVSGVSTFMQIIKNPKDFEPEKRQKPPVPYPHKVLMVSAGPGGSRVETRQLQFSLFGCYLNFLLSNLGMRRHMFLDMLVRFLFAECHQDDIMCE